MRKFLQKLRGSKTKSKARVAGYIYELHDNLMFAPGRLNDATIQRSQLVLLVRTDGSIEVQKAWVLT